MKELSKFFVILALSFLLSSNTFSLPVTVNGSVSIDYPDLTSAFDAINLGTHGSGAISVLINESHSLTSAAILNGGVFTSCEIKPTADVTVDANFAGAMIILDGADNVTIDGRIGVINLIKLNITGTGDCIEMKNGATDNVLKFVKCNNDQYGISIHISQSITGTGGNNNNSIEDSNFRYFLSEVTIGDYSNGGTKILRNVCRTIGLGLGTRDTEVRENICEIIDLHSVGVNNIISNKVFSRGIFIEPSNLNSPGSNVTEINVINNFISFYEIHYCYAFCYPNFIGLRFSTFNVSNITANIINNTITTGGDIENGWNLEFFTAIGLKINAYAGNITIKNNIVENSFPEGGINDLRYSSSITASNGANIDADYNCYYSGKASWHSFETSDITAYRAAAFPNEQHSIFKNVTFADLTTGDLHLAGASVMDEELQGIQIPGITTDIDGELRNSPFMGADEADYLLPVELNSFISSVNGNDVQLNWTTASETNNSGFDIERRDARGETQDVWNKVGFIQGHGTTTTPNNYEYSDKGLNAGKYKYRLKQIDFNGNYEYYNLSNEVVVGVPDKYSLSQNFPNPFNPTTNLEFGISNLEFVSLKVYDVMGKEVQMLVNEKLSPGMYEVKFDGSNLSSGVYFYKLTAGSFSAVKKMFLMK